MKTKVLTADSNVYNIDPTYKPFPASEGPKDHLDQGFYCFESDDIQLFSKYDVQELALKIEDSKNEIKLMDTEIQQIHSEKSQLMTEMKAIEQKLNHAKKSLMEANHKLIFSVARKHINKGLSFIELVREGEVGLEKAIDTFESSQGLHFFTYAIFWIRLSIAQAIVKHKASTRVYATDNSNVIPLI